MKVADRRLDQAKSAWERQLLVDRRAERGAALEAVLTHPAFLVSGLSAAFVSSDLPVSKAAIDGLDVERIRDELVLGSGDHPARAIARIRALKKVLGHLASRAGLRALPILIPIAVRRPIDNPFFQGACLALTQMEALRRHVAERATQRKPSRGFELQVARTFEALVLFGGLDSAGTVLEILSARSKAVRSARIPDLLLVPCSSGHVAPLRGLAAMALAGLAKAFPEQSIPSPSVIAGALKSLLPGWAMESARGSATLLDALCSTAAVVNRFEMSPATRFALDEVRGCVSATLEDQLAYIDSDPIGPRSQGADSGSATDQSRRPQALAADRRKTPRAQFTELCRLIPTPGRRLLLPLQGVEVPATSLNSETTRRLVGEELDRWLALVSGRDPLRPIVRLLGEWTRAQWTSPTRRGKPKAFRTVSTYLTRIGGALVEELGDADWHDLHEDALEAAYGYVLSAVELSKHKVAAQLLSFHKHSEDGLDCLEVDLSDIYRHLRISNRNVDTVLVLPVHREEALRHIAEMAVGTCGASTSETRVARQADTLSYFLAYGGARFSEPAWFQLRDVAALDDGALWARVRPNRARSLKTVAARRNLVFDLAGSAHASRVRAWRESVKVHHGPTRTDGAYLFADIDDGRAFDALNAVGVLIRRALATATGRPSERQHRFRHLWATERMASSCWSASDAAVIGRSPAGDSHRSPLEPRDFARIAVPLGHAHWSTTLGSYIHIPSILQSRFADRISVRWMGRAAAAAVLGVTPAQMDDIRRGRTHENAIKAWMDYLKEAREQPVTPSRQASPAAAVKAIRLDCVTVGKIFWHAEKAKDLMPALSLIGAPDELAAPMVTRVSRWERVLGHRLLPALVGGEERACPRRSLRRFKSDEGFEAIWKDVDHAQIDRRRMKALIDACFQFSVRQEEHAIVLPREPARYLVELLERYRAKGDVIEPTAVPGDLISIMVTRPSAIQANDRLLGLTVKRVLAVIDVAWKTSGDAE